MPGGVLQMEPVEFGPDPDEAERLRREDEARRSALARLAATGTPTSDEVMSQVDDARVEARDDVLGAQPVRVVRSETRPMDEAAQPPPMRLPPRLAAEQREAQAVGDAYRADPRNQQPGAFGSLAATLADRAFPEAARSREAQNTVPPPPAPSRPNPPPAPRDPASVERARELARILAERVGGPSGPAATPEQVQSAVRSLRSDRSPELAQATAAPPPVSAPAAPPVAPPSPSVTTARPAPDTTSPRPGVPPPDYTGADVSDAIRRPLHALGAALAAYAGRGATPFRSDREAAEARYRSAVAADAQRSQRESSDALARERLGMERERLDAQREDSAARRGLEAERNEISRSMQERRAEISDTRAEIAGQMAAARLAQIGDEREREAAALDPGSEPSQIARLALRTAIAGYPPEARARLAEQLGTDDVDAAIEGLNMREAEQLRASLPSMFRDTTNRRGRPSGAGGGGGAAGSGIPRAQWGTDADPLYRAALDSGTPEAAARALAMNPAERTRLARTMASGAMTETRGEGRRVEADTRALGRDLDAGARVQAATSHARRLIEGASDAELRAAFLGGELGSLTPGRIQQLRSAINEMQASVLMERSGASVAEEEFDRTRREMGTVPTQSTAVIRDWVRRHDDNARDLRRRIRARYSDDVVREYEGRLRREGVTPEARGGSQRRSAAAPTGPAAPASSGDTVRVRHPDGRTGTIPRANLERARAAGFEEVR